MSNKSLAKPHKETCILVTGGAGFIGSHTCVELLERGYRVVVVDDLSNSSETAIERVRAITAVSYTHLDVYKRQIQLRPRPYRAGATAGIPAGASSVAPCARIASKTSVMTRRCGHSASQCSRLRRTCVPPKLGDVYKRQDLVLFGLRHGDYFPSLVSSSSTPS